MHQHLLSSTFGNLLSSHGRFGIVAISIVGLCCSVGAAVHRYTYKSRQPQRLAQQQGPLVVLGNELAMPQRNNDVDKQLAAEGKVIASLSIPQIGISTVVLEGAEDGELAAAAGHIPGTAPPGEPGTVGIAGSEETVFGPLHLIRENDVIALTTRREENQYRVVSTEISGQADVQSFPPTSGDTLFLVTRFPFRSPGAARKSFIVRAERITEYSSD